MFHVQQKKKTGRLRLPRHFEDFRPTLRFDDRSEVSTLGFRSGACARIRPAGAGRGQSIGLFVQL
jgi:hypothetical protein